MIKSKFLNVLENALKEADITASGGTPSDGTAGATAGAGIDAANKQQDSARQQRIKNLQALLKLHADEEKVNLGDPAAAQKLVSGILTTQGQQAQQGNTGTVT